VRRLVIALFAAAIGLPTATASPVQAAGLCGEPKQDAYLILVARSADDPGIPGTYMDLVRGEVTVRDLDVCTLPTEGGTFVLPANVENTVTGSIFQLGYGQVAGEATEKFVFAAGSAQMQPWPDPDFVPIRGDRYRFSIWKTTLPNGNSVPQFGIRNLRTNAASFQLIGSVNWTTNYKLAWWGAETWDTASNHGSEAGTAPTTLSYMGYSPNTEGTIYYRSGMTSSDVHYVGPIPYHHGHIVNWVYGGDGLDIHTH
jgi:hypothetical protein